MATSARPKVSTKNGSASMANSTAATPSLARRNRRVALKAFARMRSMPPPEADIYATSLEKPSKRSVNAGLTRRRGAGAAGDLLARRRIRRRTVADVGTRTAERRAIEPGRFGSARHHHDVRFVGGHRNAAGIN